MLLSIRILLIQRQEFLVISEISQRRKLKKYEKKVKQKREQTE